MSSTKNCTIFVGIDQSLNSTGYYIKEIAGPGEVISDIKGLIKPGNRRGTKRLSYIFDVISKLLRGYTPSKVVVCLEGYAYNCRQGRVFELGEVGGIIKLCCFQLGIQIFSVPPTDLKKFATGKASSSKEQVMKAVGERQDDMADAKVLSRIAEEICLKKTTERKKLEVIKNALKSGRDESEKKKYSRKNKKTNRTVSGVLL